MFSQINLKVKPKEITMKFIKHAIIAGTLAFATLNVANASPILNISPTDYTLLGASGVNVGGTFYDVTFGDGIVDASAITAFTTPDGAQAASQALLDQVFSGGYYTFFFSSNGCPSTDYCGTITPFASVDGNVIGYVAWSFPSDLYGDDLVLVYSGSGGTDAFDTADQPYFNLARWTPVAAIPEPETYAMMLAGLGLLGFVSRRRKQKAAV
jgi:hypothetical protein